MVFEHVAAHQRQIRHLGAAEPTGKADHAPARFVGHLNAAFHEPVPSQELRHAMS